MQKLHEEDHVILYCAETPEDYTRMFSVPCGSCMVMPHSDKAAFYDQKLWRPMLAKYGIHPAAWYHYTGYSRGMWLEVDGVPLARCMQYRSIEGWNEDGTPKYEDWSMYGDIHHASGYSAYLLSQLAEQKLGLTSSFKMKINSVSTLNHFYVPALELDGEFYCPLAHSDFNEKDFWVAFLPAGEDPKNPGPPVFKFVPGHLGPDYKRFLHIRSTYDWMGYISATALAETLNTIREGRHREQMELKKWMRGKANVGSRETKTLTTATA